MIEYDGFIGSSGRGAHKDVKDALLKYYAQRFRCYYKKGKNYKTYGEKGIVVEYTARQFIAWYLDKIKYFKGEKPCVGRIDHNKNYSFDNIELVSRIDNSKERTNRLGPVLPKQPVVIYIYKTMEPVMVCSSQLEAAKFCDSDQGTVNNILRGKKGKSIHGYTFKYLRDTPYVNSL